MTLVLANTKFHLKVLSSFEHKIDDSSVSLDKGITKAVQWLDCNFSNHFGKITQRDRKG